MKPLVLMGEGGDVEEQKVVAAESAADGAASQLKFPFTTASSVGLGVE